MKTLYERPSAVMDVPNMFCPGCGHSTVGRLIAEVLEELEMERDTVAVMPIGCGGMIGYFLNYDTCASLHGRAPAVATGIKRMRPDSLVICYQGDGDLASIGMAETIHSANRGEHFTTIFVNNSIFGMTGGQMAPTTLVGQKSTTSINGRDPALAGYPIGMCELLDQLKAPKYIARCSLDSVPAVRKTKAAIRAALEVQMAGLGYSFVEILSPCPTGLGASPAKSMDYVREKMLPVFPTKVFRQPEGVGK